MDIMSRGWVSTLKLMILLRIELDRSLTSVEHLKKNFNLIQKIMAIDNGQ